MMNILGFALAWSLATHEGASLCTPWRTRGLRPRHALELTLRATRDSLPEVARTPVSDSDIGHRARLSWDSATVYAQIFDVIQVRGDLGQVRWRDYPRVAVVWWRLGLQCERITPKPAVRADVNELFLPALAVDRRDPVNEQMGTVVADLRQQSRWIGAIPTFDVSDGASTYSPTERKPVDPSPAIEGTLTIAEYRELFARFPFARASREEWEQSWRALLSWGNADARRWRLYPAAIQLCAAAMYFGDTARLRRHCR